MDETHVAQIKLLEGTKRAAELGQFLLKLENGIQLTVREKHNMTRANKLHAITVASNEQIREI